VSQEAAFYLIAAHLNTVAVACVDETVQRLEDEITAIRLRDGLKPGEQVSLDEAPPELVDADHRLADADDALYAATMDKFGEHAMARLFREDRKQFERFLTAGAQFFHGARRAEMMEEQTWLDGLLVAVAGCVKAESLTGPSGCAARGVKAVSSSRRPIPCFKSRSLSSLGVCGDGLSFAEDGPGTQPARPGGQQDGLSPSRAYKPQ
jgi:hypothetical protein